MAARLIGGPTTSPFPLSAPWHPLPLLSTRPSFEWHCPMQCGVLVKPWLTVDYWQFGCKRGTLLSSYCCDVILQLMAFKFDALPVPMRPEKHFHQSLHIVPCGLCSLKPTHGVTGQRRAALL